MKIKPLVIVSFCVITLSSCTSNTQEELSNTTPTPTTPTPVATTPVSYSKDIAPIISNNCSACHGATPQNGAPNSLDTAVRLKNAIQGTINRISRAQGESGLMPRNGTRLPQASIDKIIAWQTDGFKD